jgi:hypothetical protein
MSWKYLGIGVAIVIITTGALGFVFSTMSAKKEDTKYGILEASVSVASGIVQLFHGGDAVTGLKDLDQTFISPTLETQVSAFSTSLKSLDTQHFYVDKYYASVIDVEKDGGRVEIGAAPVADDEEGYVAPAYNSDSVKPVQDDPRILNDSLGDYMLLKDFDFTNGEKDIVAYRGVNMIIPKEVVPESYTRLSQDPKNYYTYTTSLSKKEGDIKYTDVQFKSVLSGDFLVIRVYNDGKKVTSFNDKGLVPNVK